MAAAASRLNRQLSSLLQGLGSANLDVQSANALRDSCDELTQEVQQLSALEGTADEVAALRRTLEHASERIEAGVLHDLYYVWRFVASHHLMSTCLRLARLAGLPADSRVRLARFCFQRLQTHGTATLQSTLQTTPALLEQAGVDPGYAATVLLAQLETAQLLQELPGQLGADPAALLPPDALVDWLKACTAVVLSLPPQGQGAKLAIGALATQTWNLCRVTSSSPFGQAIAADAQLPSDLVALLQPLVAGTAAALRLPREQRRSERTWLLAAFAAGVLTSPAVRPALERKLDADPSKAPAQLLAAAQLLDNLPLEPLPGIEPSAHLSLAYGVLAYCDELSHRAGMPGAAAQRQRSALRQQLVRQLLACMAKVPGVLRFMASQAPPDRSLLETVMACKALLMPAEFLVELSGFGPGSAGGSQRAPPATEQDAVAWCTSAAAALAAVPQLVPALRELQRSRAPEWQRRSIVGTLSNLTTMQHVAGVASLATMPSATSGARLASPATAQQALFKLHTAGCRLAAFCDANRLGAELPLEAVNVQQQLAALADSMLASLQLHLIEGDAAERSAPAEQPATAVPQPSISAQDLQCMALAHWSAVRIFVPVVAGPSSTFPSWQFGKLTSSLAACIGRGPTLLGMDPELHQLFGQMLDRVGQGILPHTFRTILVTARDGPPLAVHLLLSGRLSKMLEQVLQLSASAATDEATVWRLIQLVHGIAHGLHHTAEAILRAEGAAAAAEPHSSSGPLPALRAAQAKLSSVLDLGNLPLEEATAELQNRVLPLCHAAATELQAWWQHPEQQPALQLEVAQAAAHRSCAYLRCANLGGEGGPAAGEGVGSMRCSACRAVWYCGTACSHADWRTGHRRVCKAMGAERAAEKERRQQAAAEAAAGGAGEQSG